MSPANNHAPYVERDQSWSCGCETERDQSRPYGSITCGLQNFCRHLVFPSNCYLTLMANYSFWMAKCRTDWVKNSFWMVSCRSDWVPNSSLMVGYSFSMVSCKTCWVPNSSLMVDYSFSMASCKTGLVKSFWTVKMGRV